MRRALTYSLLFAASLFFALSSLCQDPQNDSGVHPFRSYVHDTETVSTGTGNLSLSIPLVSLPGRSGNTASLDLNFNNQIWSPGEYTYQVYSATNPVQTNFGFGWTKASPTASLSFPQVAIGNGSYPGTTPANNINCFYGPTLTLPNSSVYTFGRAIYGCTYNGGGPDQTDSTNPVVLDDQNAGIIFDGTDHNHLIFKMPDGSMYIRQSTPSSDPPLLFVDKNGNTTTYTYQTNPQSNGAYTNTITDSLGRQIAITGALYDATQPFTVTYPGAGGTPEVVTVGGTQTLSTSETCALNDVSVGATVTGGSSSQDVGTSNVNPTYSDTESYVQLPNGLTYTFRYNACGEVTLVTYPSGGYTRYTYSTDQYTRPYYFSASDPATSVTANIHIALEKDQCTSAVIAPGITTSPDPGSLSCPTGENKTTYSTGTSIGSGPNESGGISMSITTPDGTTTTHSNTLPYYELETLGNGTTCCTRTPVEYQTTIVSSDHSRNENIVTQFDSDNVHPKTRTTTLDNGKQSQEQWTNQQSPLSYNGAALTSSGGDTQAWDVQEHREYDYGSGSPGPLLRTTDYTWYTSGYMFGPGYFAHQKLSEKVYAGGASTPTSQTTYEYDNYSHINSGLQASDAVNHGNIALGSTTYSYSPSFTLRNNVTDMSRWRNTDGAWLTTYDNYDDAGNLLASEQANGAVSRYSYTDSWGDGACAPAQQSKAYRTSATNALGQSASATFNSCSGMQSASTDVNGQTTQMQYDLLNRPTQISYPNGGLVNTCYSDQGGTGCSKSSSPTLEQTVTTKMSASQSMTQTSVLDGIDRLIESQLNSDPNGVDLTDTSYDNMGRVYCVTNPYRSTSDPTYGTICQTYDYLSRPLVKTEQDGSTVSSNYTGPTTVTTNERGYPHSQTVDGLGRLVTAIEADANPGDSNYGQLATQTNYTYDALDNLACVEQHGNVIGTGCSSAPSSDAASPWRVRRFNYDSLSELSSSSSPESGMLSYTYTPDGGVLTRTDARGVGTTYSYDLLDRLKGKTYQDDPTNTPPVSYTYDVPVSGWNFLNQTSPTWTNVAQANLVGRLSYESNSNSTLVYSYDAFGRTLVKSVCTPSTCGNDHYDMHFAYDLAGDMTFADRGLDAARNAASPNAGYYYGGLTFGYNAAAQTQAATADIVDATHPAGILGAMTYTPLGAIATVELGSQYGQVFQYDQRGRTTIRYSINLAGDTVLGDQWGYDTVGNVTTANDSAQGDFSYQYDPLNRVTNASIPPFTETYSYDPWGNQTAHAVTEGSNYQWNYMPTTQNQASNPGVSYDASGNMTSDGIHNYTYDAESRTMGVTDQGVSYDYDPEGMRVATLTSGAVTAEYLYDLSSNLVTTVTNNGQLVRAILRANETHWGDYIGTGDAGASGVTTEFRLVNQVGTLVANGDTQGNFVEGCLSGPFGDGQICTPSYDYTETHFTDKLRDQESNNDYFGARYFGSTLGRFMSPDPSGLYYANPANPQSLNLYSYGQNNPLTNIDPTGKDCIHINNDTGNYEGTDIGDCDNSTEALANSGHYVDGTVASLSYNTGSGNYSFSYYSYDQSSNAVASNGIIAGAGQPITIPLSADVLNYAMNQTTPLSGPYQYGNYTGKGGMGIPRNNADAGALQHDYCYAQGGFSVGSNFGPHSAALQACNQSLCDTENSVRAGLHAKGLAMQGGQEVPGVGAEYSLTYSDFGEAAAAEDISDYFTLAPFHGNGCH